MTTTDPDEQMPRRPSEPGPVEQQASFRALLARRVAVVAGVLAVVAVLAVLVYTVLVVRQTQVVNTAKQQQRDQTLELMKDCTTPGGKCYERGQRQTAGAVGAIGANNTRAAAAASSCAASLPNPTYARVYRCTVTTLSHTGRTPPR